MFWFLVSVFCVSDSFLSRFLKCLFTCVSVSSVWSRLLRPSWRLRPATSLSPPAGTSWRTGEASVHQTHSCVRIHFPFIPITQLHFCWFYVSIIGYFKLLYLIIFKNNIVKNLFSAISVRLDGWCHVEVTVKVC